MKQISFPSSVAVSCTVKKRYKVSWDHLRSYTPHSQTQAGPAEGHINEREA